MTRRFVAKSALITLIVGGTIVGLLAGGWTATAAEPGKSTQQERPEICTEQYLPVCGKKNGVTKTYSNGCFARLDGAKVIAKGPCR
jgi:Kazal-type serine protease inhibitor domain